MPELKLEGKEESRIAEFVKKLSEIYGQDLVSVLLYGSAASGEFIDSCSNINLLVVLKNTGLDNLAKAGSLVNSFKFKNIAALFFSEDYIHQSLDVFPVEFLDMKENYTVLAGKDVLKNITVDLRNLRFQCEHELRSKLIMLRQFYLKSKKNKKALKEILFKAFTSVLHLLRNIIRMKGKEPQYLKEDIIKQISSELDINVTSWEKILAAKNKKLTLKGADIDELYQNFVGGLEKIVLLVDML